MLAHKAFIPQSTHLSDVDCRLTAAVDTGLLSLSDAPHLALLPEVCPLPISPGPPQLPRLSLIRSTGPVACDFVLAPSPLDRIPCSLSSFFQSYEGFLPRYFR